MYSLSAHIPRVALWQVQINILSPRWLFNSLIRKSTDSSMENTWDAVIQCFTVQQQII